MKENKVSIFLKSIWNKGLTTRICAVSLSVALVGGVTTSVVLLQNSRRDEKSNNYVAEDKEDNEAKVISKPENENNEIEGEKVDEENSETISREETSKTEKESKSSPTEQKTESTSQETTDVQQQEKQESQQQQETQLTVSQELIETRRLMNQAYRDCLMGGYWTSIFGFGVVDINGNGKEELLLYTYDSTTSSDIGPNHMLQYEYDPIYGGEVCGAGQGYAYLENIEYCAKSQHFVTTHYYDDGSYDFSIYEFADNSTFGPELIYYDEEGDWPFCFHVDINGKYSYGGRDNLYYSQKLTDRQVAYVVQKMNEYLPTRTKATAPHSVTAENLNKYLPVDDAGIIRQILNKQ